MARSYQPSDSRSESAKSPAPEIARPEGAVWRSLESEGIELEGQVLIVGGGNDLAARLILTKVRLALVSGGDIIIEIPRTWLRPEPRLIAENGVRLFITPDDAPVNGDATERISLRARNGRGEALHLIAAVTGRGRRDTPTGKGTALPSMTAEAPRWGSTVGAAPSVALPPLPDFNQIMAATAPKQEPTRSWPPVEQQAVSAPHRREQASSPTRVARATTSPDESFARERAARRATDGFDAYPAPVPSAVSRSARLQGTLGDGVTIADDVYIAAPETTSTSSGWGHRTAVWGLRLAIVAILIGTGGYLGRDYLRDQAREYDLPIPARIEQQLGIQPAKDDIVAQVDPEDEIPATDTIETAVATLPPSNGDNILDDRGGTTGPLPTTTVEFSPTSVPIVSDEVPTEEVVAPTEEVVADEVTQEAAPTDEPVDEVIPTDEPTLAPTDVPVEPTVQPTVEPTLEPTTEPTLEPTSEPTVEPTLEPTTEPTVEPTLEPTTEPTLEPTTEPTTAPTVEPTTAPTLEPTQEPTVAPTEGSTEAPTATIPVTPTIEPQEPSVDPSVAPDQQIADAGFRYSIDGASIGSSVPELPDINAVDYGQWVVMTVSGENTSGSDQVFDMNNFKLIADGQEVQVDVGNSWVASMLGFTPAYGNTDSILWAPGESHQFALTFLAPLDTSSLILQVGDQSLDLSSALDQNASLVAEETSATQPDYIEGKVVDILDGETILVDIDGVQQPVRYLGLDVPTGDDCYADESTQANADLVKDKTVRIERQATNADARGNWVRDVWAPDDAGTYQLVSVKLVSEGAAKAGVTEPNTRFSGWLLGSEASAKAQGVGLWESCGDAATTNSEGNGNQAASTQMVAVKPANRETVAE